MKRTFPETVSRLVVLALLLIFIIIALVAMFPIFGVSKEIDWVGMTVKPLKAKTAAAMGIPDSAGGVIVEEVEGMAARAGVRTEDVLLAINGERVWDMVDFSRITSKANLSERGVVLDVIRGGARIPVIISPSVFARPPEWEAPKDVAPAPTVMTRRWLGGEPRTCAAGEGNGGGIPAGIGGVMLDGVTRGSRAEQAGLNADDGIVSVNGRKVDTTADLWNVLAGLNGGDRVEFSVYRRGRLVSTALPAAQGIRAGGFPGRMGGLGLGPGGILVCPNCGTEVTHQRGVACFSVLCPSCGAPMMRVQ